MIPSTFGAFVGLLGLIAPGLVFQVRRESRRPAYEETTFRELSRVALTSLIFTFAAVALLAVLRFAWPRELADPRAWLAQGRSYLQAHLAVVASTIALEVALACLLGVLAAELLPGRGRAQISPVGVWYQVLRNERPDDTRPWIRLRLTDGTELTGLLRHYNDSKILENQEIAIGGPHMTHQTPDGILSKIGAEWDAAVVRGEQILYMVVRYHDKKGQPMRRRTTESPQGQPIKSPST